MSDATHDLTCLIPVLEAGAEIPGFSLDYGEWTWTRPSLLSAWVKHEEFPPEAYHTACSWLMHELHPHMTINHFLDDDNPLEALCTAWLKENNAAAPRGGSHE